MIQKTLNKLGNKDVDLLFFLEDCNFGKLLNFNNIEQIKEFFSPVSKDIDPSILHTTLYFQPKKKNIDKQLSRLLKLINNYKFTKEHISMKFELLGEREDKDNEETILSPLVDEIKKTVFEIYNEYFSLKIITNFIKYANHEDKNLGAFFAIACSWIFNHNQTFQNGYLKSDFDKIENEVDQLFLHTKNEKFKERLLNLAKLLKDKKLKLLKWYDNKDTVMKY